VTLERTIQFELIVSFSLPFSNRCHDEQNEDNKSGEIEGEIAKNPKHPEHHALPFFAGSWLDMTDGVLLTNMTIFGVSVGSVLI
jgi:hypothetical protein